MLKNCVVVRSLPLFSKYETYSVDNYWLIIVDDRLVCRLTCRPNGPLYRVTCSRCRIDTINSPDNGHMAARNMQRIEINVHEKELNVKLVIYKDSCGMLRGFDQQLVTDVSGQPVRPTFKCQSVQEHCLTLENVTNVLPYTTATFSDVMRAKPCTVLYLWSTHNNCCYYSNFLQTGGCTLCSIIFVLATMYAWLNNNAQARVK